MADRILRRPEVREMTGKSNSTIDREEKAGVFPARIQLGPCSVGWLESEVQSYIERLAASRKKAADATECA